MKRIRAFLGIVVLGCLMLCLAGTGLALEEASPRRYSYTANIVATLSISSGGTASLSGSLKSSSDSTTSRAVVTLQKRPIGGSGWTKVASWTDKELGRKPIVIKKTKSVSKGYDYRVVTRGYIEDSGGTVLEKPSKTSSIETHQ